MGIELTYSSVCAQVNAALEWRTLLEYVGVDPNRTVRSGDILLAHCPIHDEKVFRTLTLNPRNNTYHCSHVNCPGHGTADFLDLVVKATNRPLPEVLNDLIHRLGPAHFRLTNKQVALVDEMVRQHRVESGGDG